LGLGRIAQRRKQWVEAEAELEASLSFDPEIIDAHRRLASVLAKQGRYQQAIRSCERSLKLALSGHRPLDGYIVTNPERGRLGDAGHFKTHAFLADLYARQGDAQNAIARYRLALAGGYDGFGLRMRLARAYITQRNWRAAMIETARSLKSVPLSVAEALRDLPSRASKLFRRAK
jgi:tetratricopeptide (TPR) repeat protein